MIQRETWQAVAITVLVFATGSVVLQRYNEKQDVDLAKQDIHLSFEEKGYRVIDVGFKRETKNQYIGQVVTDKRTFHCDITIDSQADLGYTWGCK